MTSDLFIDFCLVIQSILMHKLYKLPHILLVFSQRTGLGELVVSSPRYGMGWQSVSFSIRHDEDDFPPLDSYRV
jgi:hypothetical protein